jgi:hypothetical protein
MDENDSPTNTTDHTAQANETNVLLQLELSEQLRNQNIVDEFTFDRQNYFKITFNGITSATFDATKTKLKPSHEISILLKCVCPHHSKDNEN